MIPIELAKKIKRIQIRTAHRVDGMLAGEYLSAFKGRGIEFEEVRPYQPGDDVRTIDWNVTARQGEPFVKLFREERELTVMQLVDVSASQTPGFHLQTKRDLISELSSTLAFSAIKNNDKTGLIMFTDGIEKFVPPKKGSRHVLRCIRELLHCQPMGQGTNIENALNHLNRTVKRRSVTFVISDFLDQNFEKSLRIASKRHDIIPIIVSDQREFEMPNVGLINLKDCETGETVCFDTSSRRQREQYKTRSLQQKITRDQIFQRLKMEPLHISTGEDYIDPLRDYFHRRGLKR
ncbi:MAG: DUF58 domain-containing protein [Planctomycetaceae bacterium]|nr:DUF58 domain-containing protein [Planctomycetaceae bacterium]MCP4479683.1 DUF58 domain-containing protein [Planctomycetaceae bacterium]MCP4775117.1 DUF58 domain-containing protein [Planctomycetaceae bacterium]